MKLKLLSSKHVETHKNSIDPRQLTYLYDLGFKALQSAQRFEDALKYKDLYYQSMLDASNKEKKHLDELLTEYKLDEQKTAESDACPIAEYCRLRKNIQNQVSLSFKRHCAVVTAQPAVGCFCTLQKQQNEKTTVQYGDDRPSHRRSQSSCHIGKRQVGS